MTTAAIDATVETLMRADDVKGLAVALIRNGRVVYLHSFGIRNAKGDPLTADTVMYAASLTKATFVLEAAGREPFWRAKRSHTANARWR